MKLGPFKWWFVGLRGIYLPMPILERSEFLDWRLICLEQFEEQSAWYLNSLGAFSEHRCLWKRTILDEVNYAR